MTDFGSYLRRGYWNSDIDTGAAVSIIGAAIIALIVGSFAFSIYNSVPPYADAPNALVNQPSE